MAARVRGERRSSENRQREREAEEADKVEVAPGVTVGSLRRFRAALIGPSQRLPKRRRPRRQGSQRERVRYYVIDVMSHVQIRGSYGLRGASDAFAAGAIPSSPYRVPVFVLCARVCVTLTGLCFIYGFLCLTYPFLYFRYISFLPFCRFCLVFVFISYALVRALSSRSTYRIGNRGTLRSVAEAQSVNLKNKYLHTTHTHTHTHTQIDPPNGESMILTHTHWRPFSIQYIITINNILYAENTTG